jgi:hypothetical protein
MDAHDDITLENGAIACWTRDNIFEPYRLTRINKFDNGSVWNDISPGIKQSVLDSQPKTEPVYGMKSVTMVRNTDCDSQYVEQRMRALIGADCWVVFVTTPDRTAIVKTYYDLRQFNEVPNDELNKVEDAKRKPLYDTSAQPLVDDLCAGHTVVLVMGRNEFKEYYFCKTNDDYYDTFIEIENDHIISRRTTLSERAPPTSGWMDK